MVAHDQRFLRGVADGIRAESEKAGAYVTHAASLGTIREKTLIGLLRDHTPRRFRVETGLIRAHQHEITSRQCDVLVHDDYQYAPLYRMEDFVIVHVHAALCVIEVKSFLNKKAFNEANQIHDSMIEIWSQARLQRQIPVFAYGLDGVSFDSFCDYIAEAASDNRLSRNDDTRHINWLNGWFCLDKNYFAIRATNRVKDAPFHCLCIDLSQALDGDTRDFRGIETGFFLQFYAGLFNTIDSNQYAEALNPWFNELRVSDEGKVWVESDGTRHTGVIT